MLLIGQLRLYDKTRAIDVDTTGQDAGFECSAGGGILEVDETYAETYQPTVESIVVVMRCRRYQTLACSQSFDVCPKRVAWFHILGVVLDGGRMLWTTSPLQILYHSA